MTYNIIMNQQPKSSKTLGPVSAAFINDLHNKGKMIFTLDDAVEIYNKKRSLTIAFLDKLVRRGVLARIKPGVYLVLKMGQEGTQLTQWPVIASALSASDDYFISHYSAMRLHGMTTHPLLDIYITMPKRKKSYVISDITYHFIYCKTEHFWGSDHVWVSKHDLVQVSDIERTILDGLDRPQLCGGIKEVVRGIWITHKKIDWEKILQYAGRYRTQAAVKRLGYILELLDISQEFVSDTLLKNVVKAKEYVLLDPSGSKEGKYISRWRVQINMNIEELKEGVWS